MQIITLDEPERKINPPGWKNSDTILSQIKNPHDLSFTYNKNLSISQHLSNEKCSANNHQNVCVLYMPFIDCFCHNLIDLLPELIYLEEIAKYDLILCEHSDTVDNFINAFDIKFKKTKFTHSSYNFTAQTIDLYKYNINERCSDKSLKLKNILSKKINLTAAPNKFIYCTRNTGGGATHGRKMQSQNETMIIDLSKEYAVKHDLEFVVFDGYNKDESRISIMDQAHLFSQAKIVTGPHGGAFANIIHIPASNNCKVCEFTSGLRTAVQEVNNFGKNYNRLFGFAPETYLDYYLIPFEMGSDKNETSINIENYKYFLNSIKLTRLDYNKNVKLIK